MLLSGGNPRVAKAEGDAPVQAYLAAMPGWKRDLGQRLDALVVRNVPFQATKQELQTLFATYAQLKSFRLPKKFDGSHRGFAFVEMPDPQAAQTAIAHLNGAELHGRTMNVNEARPKTGGGGGGFGGNRGSGNRGGGGGGRGRGPRW